MAKYGWVFTYVQSSHLSLSWKSGGGYSCFCSFFFLRKLAEVSLGPRRPWMYLVRREVCRCRRASEVSCGIRKKKTQRKTGLKTAWRLHYELRVRTSRPRGAGTDTSVARLRKENKKRVSAFAGRAHQAIFVRLSRRNAWKNTKIKVRKEETLRFVDDDVRFVFLKDISKLR